MTKIHEEPRGWPASLRHRVTVSPPGVLTTASRGLLSALFLAGVMALAGCDYFLYESVKDILAAPLKYEGQEVRLKGKVTNVTQLPLLNTKAYTLQDGDAKIVVVITQGQLPAVQDTVKLKGRVKSAMIVNGKAVGQRVEETQRIK